MKKLLAISSVLMFAICCSGCGDTHESLAAQSVSTMKEMTSVLDGVKDEASAKSAKPTLKSLMDKLNDLNTRMSKMPAPTEAQLKAMDAKYGKDMEEAAGKFQQAMFRVGMDPKMRAALDGIEPTKMPLR